MSDIDLAPLLWGKTGELPTAYHPLLCHMLDAGFVALETLASPDAAHLRHRLAALLAGDPALTPRLVAFLVALHDLGKASPSFQAKAPVLAARQREAGLLPSPLPIAGFDHSLESRLVLGQALRDLDLLALPEGRVAQRRTLDALALGAGSHHGFLHTDSVPAAYPEIPAEDDGREPWRAAWRHARSALVATLRCTFLSDETSLPLAPNNLSVLVGILNGFTILCDWLASDEASFSPYAGPM
ncbi:MAG: CRISPR-associated endonuclease Cas3'', partial [Chloroflexota bacterium]